MIWDILLIVGIVWLVGAILAWFAIKYNWRNLGTLVTKGIPDDAVASMVFVACVAWLPFLALWLGAWLAVWFADLVDRWLFR